MKSLHPDVSTKYHLVGIRPGKYNFKGFGEIDLCKLTLKKADSLVAQGFGFLKSNEESSQEEIPDKEINEKIVESKQTKKSEENASGTPEELRKNKQYVNKLLTLNYNDLSFQDKEVFFNDELYFLDKKKYLIQISNADREMQSLHAKVKALPEDPKFDNDRKVIMQQLSDLDKEKAKSFLKIDEWVVPEIDKDPSTDVDLVAQKAAEDALNKDKLIKAHNNYIYRAELTLPDMKETTPAEIKKKQEKQAEVDRRKKELEELGVPYNRKSRK